MDTLAKVPSKRDSLDKIFNSGSLDAILQKDKNKCKQADLNVMWYHGKMSRSNAEKILTEAIHLNPDTDSDGMFLVRDSTGSDVDYSLSFISDSRCYHFFIQRSKECYYQIEGGPIVHGLDMLIEHYIESADRLPTRLSKLCKGQLPPPKVRKHGQTNLLHRAVQENRLDLVKKILSSPHCPDVNDKNEGGSTALHEAVKKGLDDIVNLLLSKGAVVNMKDINTNTPLHVACGANHPSTSVLLITHDNTCIQERNPDSGWTALHVAASNGYTECAQILLYAGAAIYSRSSDGTTPIELAENYRRRECIELLEKFKESTIVTDKSDWFHPELDRQGAENIISSHHQVNGMFLIRPNKTLEGFYVLSLYKDRSVFHYEIKTKDYRELTVYYMDDGPYHRSLELLVQYYSTFEDGLGVTLQASISTNNVMKELNLPETYCNLTSPKTPTASPVQSFPSPPPKPKLPPRPTDLNSSPTAEAPVVPENQAYTSPPEENQEEILKEIPRKCLKLGAELGQGEYGSVLKGVLTQGRKGLLKKEKKDVAIKQFHNVGNVNDFKMEAQLMQSLKNEYIVQLLGVCQGPPLMLVEEYVPMGSMLDFLEDHPEKVHVKPELCLWAAQIAKGMMYLETKRMVHRDLAARNILLHSFDRIKISDFGLSRAMGTDKEYYKASKGGRWPIKWYAPESVNFGHFSHKSDVWSYGVTLWEMFSYGQAPFENMTGVEVIKFIEDGHRLEQPEKCPDVVYNVMLKCWSLDKQDRPDFSWLNQHFEEDPEYISTRELMKTLKGY